MRAVLGINDSHCATAALVVDGRVVACVSEERFTRRKNEGGYPRRSVEYCLGFLPGGAGDLEAVALAGREAMDPGWFNLLTRDEEYIDDYFEVPRLRRDWGVLRSSRRKRAWKRKRSLSKEERLRTVAGHLGVSPAVLRSVDHHLCHAAAAYYASPFAGGRALVLTNDNAGDGLCATVNEAAPRGIRRLSASRSAHGSLGSFYSLVTVFLGMRQLEHEHKVMGMAPYAPEDGRREALEVFRELMEYVPAAGEEGGKFRWRVRDRRFAHLMMKLARRRFDWVAGAAQTHLEEMLERWAREGLRLAGGDGAALGRVALSGGIFMNVKANQRLAALAEIGDLFVMPSCGDESNAIGAAYQVYYEAGAGADPADGFFPLRSLYLGPEYSHREVEEALRQGGISDRHRVSRPADVESTAADLLV
ncbi:MAG: carbamoyltransferase N-terminal domain-containing protein, partial [Nitrospinota bacterium]